MALSLNLRGKSDGLGRRGGARPAAPFAFKRRAATRAEAPLGHVRRIAKRTKHRSHIPLSLYSLKNGGVDGTRTRDLRRDRPAF